MAEREDKLAKRRAEIAIEAYENAVIWCMAKPRCSICTKCRGYELDDLRVWECSCGHRRDVHMATIGVKAQAAVFEEEELVKLEFGNLVSHLAEDVVRAQCRVVTAMHVSKSSCAAVPAVSAGARQGLVPSSLLAVAANALEARMEGVPACVQEGVFTWAGG